MTRLSKEIVEREGLMEKNESEILKCCNDISNAKNTIMINDSQIVDFKCQNESLQDKIKEIELEISKNNQNINSLLFENKLLYSTKKEQYQLLESLKTAVIDLKTGLKEIYTDFINSKTLLIEHKDLKFDKSKRLKLSDQTCGSMVQKNVDIEKQVPVENQSYEAHLEDLGSIKQSKSSAKISKDENKQTQITDLKFLDPITTYVESLYLKKIEAQNKQPPKITLFKSDQTIRTLLVIDGILVDETDLNFPSSHVNDISQLMGQGLVKVTSQVLASGKLTVDNSIATSKFKPYISLLDKYRSLRVSPVDNSLSFESKLDPLRNLCRFDILNSKCTKKKCTGQHLKDLKVSGTYFYINFRT